MTKSWLRPSRPLLIGIALSALCLSVHPLRAQRAVPEGAWLTWGATVRLRGTRRLR